MCPRVVIPVASRVKTRHRKALGCRPGPPKKTDRFSRDSSLSCPSTGTLCAVSSPRKSHVSVIYYYCQMNSFSNGITLEFINARGDYFGRSLIKCLWIVPAGTPSSSSYFQSRCMYVLYYYLSQASDAFASSFLYSRNSAEDALKKGKEGGRDKWQPVAPPPSHLLGWFITTYSLLCANRDAII